ncbi:signal peptidase I [Peribacillus sp. SCS-155]|uniref:signal peptidase I n=1 Tax=Peribacillus sedimenti TaxID=3115297 RepID=UPI0039065235
MNENAKREAWSWIKSLLIALVIVFICREFIFTPVKVEGKSMMPTFEDNNRIIVSKISKLEHLDMIVFHSPVSSENYIKRLIGMPGDVVEVKDDTLFINGKKYEEPYLKANKQMIPFKQHLTEDFKVTVPNGSLFVMGDNRRNSSDSREFGFIAKKAVIGEVKFRFYPLREVGMPH